MMKAHMYERLSTIYDLDWGDWARQYVPVVCKLFKQSSISDAKILDLACGTGNLALALAKLDHTVVGIDISPYMIEVAKAKAAGLAGVRFVVGNMAHFDIEEEFDCVLCTFDALNYLLTQDLVRATFQRVARVLVPSGFFVFDCITENLFLNQHIGIRKRQLGGESFHHQLLYDPERGIATTAFSFSDGTKEIHKQRAYGFSEIHAELFDTGFEIVRADSGFYYKPHTEESERIVYIARKRVQ